MNTEWISPKKFGFFAALHGGLLWIARIIDLSEHQDTFLERAQFSIVGTLSFPLMAFSKPDLHPDLPIPLEFDWWNENPLELPLLVCVLNVIFWTILDSWTYSAAVRHLDESGKTKRRLIGLGVVLLLYILSNICFLLFITITYTDAWRDFISVFGTLATLLAFCVAIKQIADAKRIVEAERDASKQTALRIGNHHSRHMLNESMRFFSQARTNLKTAKTSPANSGQRTAGWRMASEYLSMTLETLNFSKHTLSESDISEIDEICQAMRILSNECDRMCTGGVRFKDADWNNLDESFTQFILPRLHPIA